MKIAIVTDSTCDLPASLVDKYQITVIPLPIIVNNRELRDGVDMTRQEFYERLSEFKPPATTAAPSPDVFRQAFEQQATKGATEILSLHVSERLSAIVNIATQAAREFKNLPVTVFDSRQLSLGTGFQALAAAQAAAAGCSMSEILARLEEQIKHTHVFAALDTLEFLRRSGRMNAAVSFLGTLLQVKPVLKMYDGNPTAERKRTRHGALTRLKDMIEELHPFERAAILHSRARERAVAFLEEVRHLLPAGDIPVEEITPVLGAHIGPGVIGFAGISKNSRTLEA